MVMKLTPVLFPPRIGKSAAMSLGKPLSVRKAPAAAPSCDNRPPVTLTVSNGPISNAMLPTMWTKSDSWMVTHSLLAPIRWLPS